MRWGFGASQGPFELWQQAGWSQVAGWIRDDIEAGKTLSNALHGVASVEQIERAGVDPRARAEQLAPSAFVALADAVTAH
jgi:hypothetical protein